MPEAPDSNESGYQSLYRRFRPQRFAEVLGQDHVALALRNAVRDSQIGHAYLFSGPRGTGKTSTARILGKALNCANPVDGEPCGICPSCQSVAAGTSFDVHELDAASNGRVEDIRDLISRAALATPGRWKVYILDEVHMLSTAASNALLRTLEEPPDHVVFVLATTDPQKVLPTIRSRTQHFEFHLISDDVLASLLTEIAQSASLRLPEGALVQAVRRGRGSARDALSILDQVAASGVSEIGADQWLTSVIEALDAYDQRGVLLAVETAVRGGRDAQQLALDFIDRVRVGFLSLVSNGALDGGLELHTDELDALRQLGTARIVRAMELIGHSIVQMRDVPDPRITLEVAFLRLARPEDEISFEAVVERLDRLERRIDSSPLETSSAPHTPPPPPPSPSPSPSPQARTTSPPRGEANAGADDLASQADEAGDSGQSASPASRDGIAPRPTLGAFVRRDHATPTPPSSPEVAPTSNPDPTEIASLAQAALGKEHVSIAELNAAWNNTVLVSLRPKVRAIFQAARLSAVEESKVTMTVPNDAHMLHAEPLRAEVETAFRKHFGRTLSIHLISEGVGRDQSGRTTPNSSRTSDQRTVAGGTPNTEGESEISDEDFADLAAPRDDERPIDTGPTGVDLAKARVLEAFPGAEEV